MTDTSPTNEYFLWRGDPEETFSDWTLEIISDEVTEDDEGTIVSPDAKETRSSVETTVSNGKMIQKYFVHRGILSCGIRRSKYFASQFLHAEQGRCNESVTQTSRIELPPLAAEAIPDLLDYLYGFEFKLNWAVCPRVLVGLHYLADYFEIGSLLKYTHYELKKKIERLPLRHAKDIYLSADSVFDEAIISLVARFIAGRFNSWCTVHEFVECADLEFWLKVASEIRSMSPNPWRWKTWSRVVLELSKQHSDDFTHKIFKKMTSVDILPSVCLHEALPLLELEVRLESAVTQDDSEKEDNEESLQSRCHRVYVDNWHLVPTMEEDVTRLMTSAPQKREFIVGLLLGSLKKAISSSSAQTGRSSSALTGGRANDGYLFGSSPTIFRSSYSTWSGTRIDGFQSNWTCRYCFLSNVISATICVGCKNSKWEGNLFGLKTSALSL
mmetsp:Transcript_35742/g.86333  ORF Transcript_35742/g.86333 Transcript_35742/m.86333 type:complete len:441 (-) Transcript_35742:317-1639(-)